MPQSIAQRDPLVQSFLTLSTANVSDALDHLGLAGAPLGLRALWPGAAKLAGRAVTLRLTAVEEGGPCPVTGTLEAIRRARTGDVLVVDHGGSSTAAGFDGVAACAAARRGIAGCVIDGLARDVDEMREIHFSVYGRGAVQLSARGRASCAGYQTPVELGGVACRPGDVVLADGSGVVVVPHERASEVLELGHAVLAAENRIKDAIARGADPLAVHTELGEVRLARAEAPTPARGRPAE